MIPGILLPTSQGFVISLLGNQWVSSLGLPVLDLRRMLLLLLLWNTQRALWCCSTQRARPPDPQARGPGPLSL